MINHVGSSGWGVDPQNASQHLLAQPTIFKLSLVASTLILGQDTSVPVSIYSVDMIGGVSTLLGTGTVGTLIDHVDFFNNPATTLYLVIKIETSHATDDTIYGGILYSDLGSSELNWNIPPANFVVVDP